MTDDDADQQSSPRRQLDPVLRDDVVGSTQPFADAFDRAAAQPTPDAIDELRAAADRLMRAAARVLIEIERTDC